MRVGIMLTTSGLESALEQRKLGNPLFGAVAQFGRAPVLQAGGFVGSRPTSSTRFKVMGG